MESLHNVIKLSSKWLLAQQDKASGGWPDRGGMQPNALNTAESIVALIDSGIRAAGSNEIQNAVTYLSQHQLHNGQDKGAWPREVHREDGTTMHIPDLVRTSFCVQALIKAGVGIDKDATKNAVAWLLGKQNADHGWSYASGQASALMPTSFALMALIESYDACQAECKNQIEQGLDFLVTFYDQGPDKNLKGSFGGPAPLLAVHTIYAALVLQKARRNKLSKYADEEKRAIDWLLSHPDDANRLVEERVTIDASGLGDYGFLFTTDSLLLRLLIGSGDKKYAGSKLAREAVISLKDKQDPTTGAFYGYRTFTWSTAKYLSALAIAKALPSGRYEDLPQRAPEYTGLGQSIIQILLFVFALLLTAGAFYLQVNELFSTQVFVFYVVMMLVLLLAFEKIGEKSFVELAGPIIKPFQRKQ